MSACANPCLTNETLKMGNSEDGAWKQTGRWRASCLLALMSNLFARDGAGKLFERVGEQFIWSR